MNGQEENILNEIKSNKLKNLIEEFLDMCTSKGGQDSVSQMLGKIYITCSLPNTNSDYLYDLLHDKRSIIKKVKQPIVFRIKSEFSESEYPGRKFFVNQDIEVYTGGEVKVTRETSNMYISDSFNAFNPIVDDQKDSYKIYMTKNGYDVTIYTNINDSSFDLQRKIMRTVRKYIELVDDFGKLVNKEHEEGSKFYNGYAVECFVSNKQKLNKIYSELEKLLLNYHTILQDFELKYENDGKKYELKCKDKRLMVDAESRNNENTIKYSASYYLSIPDEELNIKIFKEVSPDSMFRYLEEKYNKVEEERYL